MTEATPDPAAEPAMPPPPTRATFAGFVPRAAALAIDLVLIRFLGYTLDLAARETLLLLGPALPFLSAVAAFLYFWLANGPLGGGATIGKSILNLRVVDAGGRPLDALASLKRTTLQFPHIAAFTYTFLAAGRLAPELRVAGLQVLQVAVNALLMTNVVSIVTHPQRRGWHDLAAGSYVTPDPLPETFAEEIDESAGEAALALRAAHRRLTRVTFGSLMFMLPWLTGLFAMVNPEARAKFVERERLAASLVEGFQLEPLALNYAVDPGSAPPAPRATTPTLEGPFFDENEFAVTFRFASIRGALDREVMQAPAMRSAIDAMLRRMPETYDQLKPIGFPPLDQVVRFEVHFRDRFGFVIFSKPGDFVYLVRVPAAAPPASATYEWIDTTEKPDDPAGEG